MTSLRAESQKLLRLARHLALAERQVGRVGNLTQVLPELLTHISAGLLGCA